MCFQMEQTVFIILITSIIFIICEVGLSCFLLLSWVTFWAFLLCLFSLHSIALLRLFLKKPRKQVQAKTGEVLTTKELYLSNCKILQLLKYNSLVVSTSPVFVCTCFLSFLAFPNAAWVSCGGAMTSMIAIWRHFWGVSGPCTDKEFFYQLHFVCRLIFTKILP